MQQTTKGLAISLELLQLAFQSPSKSNPFSSHGTHPCQSLLQGKHVSSRTWIVMLRQTHRTKSQAKESYSKE
ncbi:hypothetical protein POPTR_014G003175v4 [Populus trichocarpa]|uniref:Uncharacterized protein n=1 Tax=Populus trichocarpa TaxID=3694 RepID=A0ACC0RYF2_POPTR|nr:hypothetical protein POPTR_014G003175v4 [Populus trichocarpa]